MSASGVAASRLASIASMSSWLLLATGSGAGGGGGGAGFGAAAGFGARRNRRRRDILHHRRSARSFAAWRQPRLRRLFGSGRLGLVVGDDATDRRQNLLHRGLLDLCRLRHLRLHIETIIYTKPRRNCRFRICRPGFSSHWPDLSPDQARPHASRGVPLPSRQPERASVRRKDAGHESPARPRNGTSWPQMIASKAPGALSAGRRFHPACAAIDSDISGRRACERRPSCRAPDDSARSDRRPWSAG